MTIDIDGAIPAAGAGRERRKSGFLRAVLAKFVSYLEKRETRWDLRDLTDDQLRDIGMTRGEARIEVSKSWFWG